MVLASPPFGHPTLLHEDGRESFPVLKVSPLPPAPPFPWLGPVCGGFPSGHDVLPFLVASEGFPVRLKNRSITVM